MLERLERIAILLRDMERLCEIQLYTIKELTEELDKLYHEQEGKHVNKD